MERREIIEIVAAFGVAWLVYQLLVIATGTALPVVSVVSNSMLHEQRFGEWWSSSSGFYEQRGIGMSDFASFPMANGFSMGDLLFVARAEPRIGDVIIYQRSAGSVVIVHRLIAETNGEYVTKGDNNPLADEPISKDAIIGRALFAVPLLGYPRTLLHFAGI